MCWEFSALCLRGLYLKTKGSPLVWHQHNLNDCMLHSPLQQQQNRLEDYSVEEAEAEGDEELFEEFFGGVSIRYCTRVLMATAYVVALAS